MSEIIFRAHARSLRVNFPPETFGYAQGQKIMKDRHGQVIVDPDTSGPLYEQLLKPMAKFEGGQIVLNDEKPEQAVIIADLRRILNDKELGLASGLFWEEDPRVSAHVNAKPDEISVSFPPEMTEEDHMLISKLSGYFHNPIPGHQMKAAQATLQDALVRFNVVGIVMPGPSRTKLIKPRILELCYALHDAAAQASIPIPLTLDAEKTA